MIPIEHQYNHNITPIEPEEMDKSSQLETVVAGENESTAYERMQPHVGGSQSHGPFFGCPQY